MTAPCTQDELQAQRFGLGVPLADRALRENGNPPAEFEFQPAQVTVTLRPAG